MKGAILCVDDEAIIVMALKAELRSHYRDRFVYETALNASDALAIVEELSADGRPVVAIISDWLMPGIKGDEFISRVREKHPETRAVIITGQADENTLGRLLRDGDVSAVVRKPWTSRQLVAAVDGCLA